MSNPATGEVLTDFRLLFGGITLALIVLLLVTIFTRRSRQSLTFTTNLVFSLGLIVFAVLTIITENRVLALTQLSGDRLTFYLFIASIVLGIANPIVHKLLHGRSRSYRRYHF